MVSTNPARGTRDFLPADVRKRAFVIGIIKDVYESYGFEPLETPAMENIETLTGKYGEEGSQLIFRILKRGEKLDYLLRRISPQLALRDPGAFADLALRYDLTVPLARVVANNREELPKFFKRYQIQPVWRADRPARGRFREFFQCDVDAIGSGSMVIEGEILSAVSEILRRLGFNDFTIRLNDRRVLTDILEAAGVPGDLHNEALVAIDKLDKIGAEGVAKELNDRGISEASSTMLQETFAKTQAAPGRNEEVNQKILADLTNVVSEETLASLGRILRFADKAPIVLDPSLARGLSYYTGAIMEINVPDLGGSLGGGGRYDGLIGMFGKVQIPACGFSLGLERILVVMDERGMFPPEIAESASADIMITIFSEETVGESLELADRLRSDGLRVSVYPQADKEDRQWKYANSIGVKWLCTFDPADFAANMASFQNLRTKEKFREPISGMAAKIKEISSQ